MTFNVDQLSVLWMAVQTAEDFETKQACQQALQYYALAMTPEILTHIAELEAALPAQDGWQDIASARAAALEEAAVIAETWFDHHRPQQPKKSRFDIYDIQHWAKTATKLVAEDIRARIAPPPPGAKP
jgi:hypothetical protein